MLVLNHRIGEDVVITLPDGRQILVTYLGMHLGHERLARVGYTAPKDIIIDRRAIYARKVAERGGHGDVDGNRIDECAPVG